MPETLNQNLFAAGMRIMPSGASLAGFVLAILTIVCSSGFHSAENSLSGFLVRSAIVGHKFFSS